MISPTPGLSFTIYFVIMELFFLSSNFRSLRIVFKLSLLRLFNNCCWKKWLSVCKKLKLDHCLLPCTSINSKWIKDLNIRPETLKLAQKGAGNTLEVIGIGKNFVSRTPATQQLRERMDKWDFKKLKYLF
jgi:hypothetical protein